jgi:predicted metal-dependent enzyme (double-stranded beta helix superfamily)
VSASVPASELDGQASASITAAMTRIRALVGAPARESIGALTLASIGATLTEVGGRLEQPLARLAQVTRPKAWGRCLSVDSEYGFALYLASEEPGSVSPPHEHMTWQVTSSIRGTELQCLYLREGATRRARESWRVTLRPRMHMAMLAHDIHASRVISEEPTLHLQVYGAELGGLPDFATRTFEGEGP